MKFLSNAATSKWALRLVFVSFVLLIIPAARTQETIRVFVTDSHSWQISGGFAGTGDIAVGSQTGGARPQKAEILKTFRERCPQVTPTINREKAAIGKAIIRFVDPRSRTHRFAISVSKSI